MLLYSSMIGLCHARADSIVRCHPLYSRWPKIILYSKLRTSDFQRQKVPSVPDFTTMDIIKIKCIAYLCQWIGLNQLYTIKTVRRLLTFSWFQKKYSCIYNTHGITGSEYLNFSAHIFKSFNSSEFYIE